MSISGVSLDKIIEYLYEQARRYGMVITLLACAVWYFHGETREMKAELLRCNSEILEMYREDREQMFELVQNNTRALVELQQSIQNHR